MSLYGQFFRRLYAQDLDKKGICNALRMSHGEVCFREAAEAFKLIDEDGSPVLVRYRSERASDDVDGLVGKLHNEGPHRWLMRKLQRYLVTLYRRDVDRLLKVGDIRPVERCPGLYEQVSEVLYDPQLGVLADGAPGDPASLVY